MGGARLAHVGSLAKVTASVNQAVADRFMLQEDARTLIDEATPVRLASWGRRSRLSTLRNRTDSRSCSPSRYLEPHGDTTRPVMDQGFAA